jgi:hypothetical protein
VISTIEVITAEIGGVPAHLDPEEGGTRIGLEAKDAEARGPTDPVGGVHRGTVRIAGRSDSLNVSDVKHQLRCPT